MPCTKCKDSDTYKWGKTGECEYPTKEACESANTKYSKMRPTPLGKKTYEEYEKELKEFNLSKVEKVELGLVDDLDKLFSETVKLDDEIDKSYKSLRSAAVKTSVKIEKAEKIISVITKQAKELGVDIDTVLASGIPARMNNIKKKIKAIKSL